MPTSVNFKNISKVQRHLMNQFVTTKQNRTLQKQMGVMIAKRIKFQARKGRPMRGVGKVDGFFPDLSDFSIAARKILAPFNVFHRAFRKNKIFSNVTMTGQLVDAVKFRFKNPRTGSIEVYIAPSYRRQLEFPTIDEIVAVSPKKDIGKNIAIVRWLENQQKETGRLNSRQVYLALLKIDKEYDFLNVNTKIKLSLNKLVLRFLRKALRKGGF